LNPAVGTRLGPYEIVHLLGSGGMGEVYRARDTRLGRDVALKFVPAEFTADRERLARFEREARLLASLNHPNIATIHGVEDAASDGRQRVRAIVLELVEGATLADSVRRGRLRLEEALVIARQIAEALDAAHEKGIIHRDLKLRTSRSRRRAASRCSTSVWRNRWRAIRTHRS
jgi:serine/threonine protein kinase